MLARHRWRTMTRHAEALARRPASPCDRGRAPLGALPWRFLGLRVRVSGSGIILRSACSDAPRGRVLVSGERLPCLPGLRLRAAAAERHSLLRPWTVSGRRPSNQQRQASNTILGINCQRKIFLSLQRRARSRLPGNECSRALQL